MGHGGWEGANGLSLHKATQPGLWDVFIAFFPFFFFFFKGRQGAGGYPSQEIKAKMSLYQRKLSSSPYSLTMLPKGGHAND